MVKPSFKSLTRRGRIVCVGCGYSCVRFGDAAGQGTRQWVKVNHESGLGLCSSCDAFLLQERQRRQRHDNFCNAHLCSQRSNQCRMAVVDDLYSSFFPFKSIGYEYKDAVRTF